jgi:hypothetical protein
MGNLRFVLAAIALFAGTFAGVSWASRSFPAMTVRAVPAKPDMPAPIPAPEAAMVSAPALAPIVKPAAPVIEEAIRQEARPTASPPARDPESGRNQMRLTAIQAATAYATAPCDQANKAAFVVAASTYARAMTADDNGTPAPSTALDRRVREAIHAALNAGGIAHQDFPAGAEPWVAAMVPSHREKLPSCATPRQADRRAR